LPATASVADQRKTGVEIESRQKYKMLGVWLAEAQGIVAHGLLLIPAWRTAVA
jgi:hypothetical protein